MRRFYLTLISTLFLVMIGTLATKGFFDIPASSARIPSYAGLEMTSVKEYGAIGDGQTDDTAAIQAAIDAMPDAGGVIYLPIGTYLVRPLDVPNPCGLLHRGQLPTGMASPKVPLCWQQAIRPTYSS